MRRQKARKKNLTLVEIMIVVIVVGIIATLAVPGYNNLVENSKSKVCEANQNVLLGAVEVYALENDKLPGALGQLKNEHLRKAWAKILKENGDWKLKLAYFIVDFEQRGLAYAQGAWIQRYIGNSQYLVCPADPTPPPAGVSYGINANAKDISYDDYKDLDANTIIVCDSDSRTFTPGTEAQRHKKHGVLTKNTFNYTLGISKGKNSSCKGEGCPGGFSKAISGGFGNVTSGGYQGGGAYQGGGWMIRAWGDGKKK